MNNLIARVSSRIFARITRARALVPVGAVAVAAVAAVVVVSCDRGSTPLVRQIAARGLPRPYGPRISIAKRFRACAPNAKQEIPVSDCAERVRIDADERLHELQVRARTEAESGDPEGIHADAMLDLMWADTGVASVSRAIERLLELASADEASADVLSDLSAMLLVRAGWKQSYLDLLAAAEASEKAVEQDSTLEEALFNRAFALEQLRFETEAAEAWKAYLAVDSESEWAEEARRHVAALRWTPPPPPNPQASDSALKALARTSPQEAREFAWDTLLREWGRAVLAQEGRSAEGSLHRAEIVGRELEEQGLDASTADAVRAIRSGPPAVIRRLARGHQSFGEARKASNSLRNEDAERLFAIARDSGAVSLPLRAWAAVHLAPVASGREPADRVLSEVLASIDTLRYPALAGKANWTLGMFYVRRDSAKKGLSPNRAAVSMFQRSREIENLAGAQGGCADAEHMTGDRLGAYNDANRAVAMLGEYGDSRAFSRIWPLLATWLSEDGYTKTALRVSAENVAAAQRSGVDLLMAEAHDFYSEALAQEGDTAAALAELAAAAPRVQRLDGRAREYFTAVLGATDGAIGLQHDPDGAVSKLTKALAYLDRPSTGVPLRLIHVLLARADAWAALGEADSARADTEYVLKRITDARGGPTGWRMNRELSQRVRSTLNSVVLRLVAKQKPGEALKLLETGLASLGPNGTSALPSSMPAGQVAVRYAVIGDTLLAWTLTSGGLQVAKTPVRGRDLAQRAKHARDALQHRDDNAAGPDLEILYDWLIRPIEARLAAPDTSLVIIPDGAVAGAPFLALRDRQTGEYFIQRHAVRLAATIAQAGEAAPDSSSGDTVVVVLDPAFDRQLYPRLRLLPGARQESAAVRGWAAGRPLVSLAAANASASALSALLPRASVLHFAGHAISNEDEPGSSFLVLASGRGEPDAGRLTAAQIAGMKLDGLDLVVLSACSTLNDARGGAAGFTGLGGAFLSAGARGVIGSLWQVNDDRTSLLMQEFYAKYRTNRDASSALRQAQIEMLRSNDARKNSPASWGGFEYAGR
ncbi:CHAT domain-containing protein [Longimicrobium sp.]|uniref:CHAT domain-containing protein n=1 Tax=Longimicrobium sp. TaxID=2029185 RepID=UPI002CAD0399|nr:CHAT domain-containing protein [Longimicrobium sp.]HSU13464.1 CHAT domain-containing protein [Longimicrobium sp.]